MHHGALSETNRKKPETSTFVSLFHCCFNSFNSDTFHRHLKVAPLVDRVITIAFWIPKYINNCSFSLLRHRFREHPVWILRDWEVLENYVGAFFLLSGISRKWFSASIYMRAHKFRKAGNVAFRIDFRRGQSEWRIHILIVHAPSNCPPTREQREAHRKR